MSDRTDCSEDSCFQEDESFHDHYEIDGLIGHGGSAKIYEVHRKGSWQRFACKEISLEGAINSTDTLQTELQALRRTNHPNVLKMVEAFETAQKAWLVLELVEGGDLVSALGQLPRYSERNIAKLFKQLLLGMKHLHEQGVVHRDLKIENLLCAHSSSSSDSKQQQTYGAEELTVKIADFGLSAVSSDWKSSSGSGSGSQPAHKPSKHARHLKEMWGTTEYFAPEVYEKAYGFQADVWSLGCVLFEMLTGHLAFPKREVLQPLRSKLFHDKPKRCFEERYEWDDLSPAARSLIKGMLRRNPLRRLSVEECLQHPWICSADNNCDKHLPRVKKMFQQREHKRTAARETKHGELFIH